MNKVNSFELGLNQDSSPERQPSNTARFVLNGVDISSKGDLFKLTSELGTIIFCNNLPLGQVIGGTVLNTDQILFIVNGSLGDAGYACYIGIVDNNGTFTIKVNSTDLNFSIDHPIQAVARINFAANRVVYFTDDYNPFRRIDLDSVEPFDITETTIVSSLSLPVVKFLGFNESASGRLFTGVYQFIARYLESDLTPTTFGFHSNPVPVIDELRTVGRDQYDGAPFDTEVNNKTIRLELSNLDTSKPLIELVAYRFVGAAQQIEIKSFYRGPITGSTQTIEFSGLETAVEEVALEEIILEPVRYTTAKTIVQKDNRLLLGNLRGRSEGDLQPIANNILVTYDIVEEEYLENDPAYFDDYKGEEQTFDKKTYMGEETYAFALQAIYMDGSKSLAYHIPAVNPSVGWVNADDYSITLPADYTPETYTYTPKWYPANFSTQTNGIGSKSNLKLGTYVSQEKYESGKGYPNTGISDIANNVYLRHHVIPPLDIEPHFRNDAGTQIIRYKRLRFTQPDFSSLPNADDIVGYVILRADRDLNNRSVQSQGIYQRTIQMQAIDMSVDPAPYANGTLFYMEVPGMSNMIWETDGTSTGANDAAFMAAKNFLPVLNNDPGQRNYHIEQLSDYSDNLITYYGPDFILGNVPLSPNRMKEKLTIQGTFQPIASQFHFNDNFAHEGGGSSFGDEDEFTFRIFCNYNNQSSRLNKPFTVVDEYNFSNSGNEQQSTYEVNSKKVAEIFNTPHYTLDILGTEELYQDPSVISMRLKMDNTLSGADTFDSDMVPRSGMGLGSGSNTKALVNLYNNYTRQYGALGNLEYFPIAIIPDKNTLPEENDGGDYILVYNGDIFISKFAVVNSALIHVQVNAKNDTESRAPHQIDNFTGYKGMPIMCLSYFFVESVVNCNYRHAIEDGVLYYPKSPAVEILGQGVTAPSAPPLIPGIDPAKGHATGYNLLYSRNNTLKTVPERPLGFVNVSEYPNRIIYSQAAIESEQSDSYRIFLANNFHDIPKDKGEIWNLFVWGNTLYAHCPKTLWRTFANEVTALQGSFDSADIFVGSGGMFPRPAVEVLTLSGGYAGTISQFAGVGTPSGYIFPDILQSKIFKLGQGLEELSANGMSSFFMHNLKHVLVDGKYLDNPFNPEVFGALAVYDGKLDRYILTNHYRDSETEDFTISYSFKSKSWRSLHSYTPHFYLSNDNRMFGVDNTETQIKVYEHDRGEYLKYYFNTEPSQFIIHFVITGDGETLIEDNLFINSICRDEVAKRLLMQTTFDSIRVHNEEQNTDSIEIITDNSFGRTVAKNQIKAVEKKGEFRVAIPKDAVIDNSEDIFDASNLDVNRLFRPRIKGKYAIVELTYNPAGNYKFTVNYIGSGNRGYNI